MRLIISRKHTYWHYSGHENDYACCAFKHDYNKEYDDGDHYYECDVDFATCISSPNMLV